MASITIRNLCKQYGNTRVIHDVSMEIRDGEFVALVGPSGCGKSTLLRMVAGLEDVSSGEIRLGDRVINTVAPRERNVAMVFQNYALYPHMTVRQNLGFSLRLQGFPKEEIDKRVAQAAETLGLSGLLDRMPRHLSGGQRQRVAMGRAIVRQPAVFLFDEPLSNLDAKLRVQMRTEIKALHQRLGTTMLYVTHDQVEAMTMADRIIVLKNGVVEQSGAPLDLYDRPCNAFVAGFIGSPAMNFIRGRVQRDAEACVLTDDGYRLPLPQTPDVAHGQEVLYGVRPEHFTLEDADGLHAQVVVTEPTGAETQIAARLGAQDIIVAFRDRLDVRSGNPLRLSPRPEHVHLFDASSGSRLM